jgi:hypothetical protein
MAAPVSTRSCRAVSQPVSSNASATIARDIRIDLLPDSASIPSHRCADLLAALVAIFTRFWPTIRVITTRAPIGSAKLTQSASYEFLRSRSKFRHIFTIGGIGCSAAPRIFFAEHAQGRAPAPQEY